MLQVIKASSTLIFLLIWSLSPSINKSPVSFLEHKQRTGTQYRKLAFYINENLYMHFFKVGSFLMGWFGVVFKKDITKVSDQLAIGLSTGYLGSLTTFSGWNQKMLDLSVNDKWVFAVLGIFIGTNIIHHFGEKYFHLFWVIFVF